MTVIVMYISGDSDTPRSDSPVIFVISDQTRRSTRTLQTRKFHITEHNGELGQFPSDKPHLRDIINKHRYQLAQQAIKKEKTCCQKIVDAIWMFLQVC